MSHVALLETENAPNRAVAEILARLLREDAADAVLVLATNQWSSLPMPTLCADPEVLLAQALPLAPAAAVNMAVQAARASRGRKDHRLAVVCKPCELRALIELAKLQQADLEGLALISLECRGRLENSVYLEEQDKNEAFADFFVRETTRSFPLARTCASCDEFEPRNADLTLHVLGVPVGERLAVSWQGETGAALAAAMGLRAEHQQTPDRAAVVAEIKAQRAADKQALFEKTGLAINSLAGLQALLGTCLGCLNCRMACPVCYCRECICGREAFDRDPVDLQAQAAKQGAVRLPGEITMFHLTRMAHMAHACVGCGQCSSVCPSNIPVADIFRVVASGVQGALRYKPGQDASASIPYLDFSQGVHA